MQVTFDLDSPSDVERVRSLLDTVKPEDAAPTVTVYNNMFTAEDDVTRLMKALAPEKRRVMKVIAQACDAKGDGVTVEEVAGLLSVERGTLISHKMNIGRTVKRLGIINPVRTSYPNGKAIYRMDSMDIEKVLEA